MDTSVWIDFFKERPTKAVQALEEIIQNEDDVFTTGMILQEVLTGIKKERERKKLLADFRSLVLLMPTVETHVEASEIYDRCRKKGLTVRSTVDCLIAALAIGYDVNGNSSTPYA